MKNKSELKITEFGKIIKEINCFRKLSQLPQSGQIKFPKLKIFHFYTIFKNIDLNDVT